MNYRHSFHAGNSADVVKHSLLIALIRALQLKDSALTLIDTHAGCGLYDLGGEEAKRTGDLARIKAMILVDMIGDRDLVIKREPASTAWLVSSCGGTKPSRSTRSGWVAQ